MNDPRSMRPITADEKWAIFWMVVALPVCIVIIGFAMYGCVKFNE